jgi:hypothetical protein
MSPPTIAFTRLRFNSCLSHLEEHGVCRERHAAKEERERAKNHCRANLAHVVLSRAGWVCAERWLHGVGNKIRAGGDELADAEELGTPIGG